MFRVSSASTVLVACTLLGSWIGAFTIALDWEQPWHVSHTTVGMHMVAGTFALQIVLYLVKTCAPCIKFHCSLSANPSFRIV